jgi:glycosyltransferase involved in cell wall biosynthesis
MQTKALAASTQAWLAADVPATSPAPALRQPSWGDSAALRPTNARCGGYGGPPRLAYFINLFPNLIETMIYREVESLRATGYTASIFSIRRPDDSLIPPEAEHLVAGTYYILPVSPWRLVASHLGALLRYPLRYWQILFEVLNGTHARLRGRFRTLCHFAEAVVVLPVVERLGVDHLHAHWALGSTTIAMVVSRFLGIPFSFTAHAYDIWRERLLLPEKLRAAALTVTCTDCNRRHLIEVFGADPVKVRVVYHGLDVAQFQSRPRAVNAEPVVLSVGRLVEQKGFDRLLRACAALAAEGVRFQCDIVGEGPLRAELEALKDELQLGGRVRFLGKMFHDELIDHYAEADVFALLCVPASDDDRDGIPNTLIEAMAMELPVVSTRFSGVPELVVDGETGLLVETDDHSGAVTALRTLLNRADLRARLGRAGRRRVREGFTIQASAAKLDATFTSLLAARASERFETAKAARAKTPSRQE